MSNIGSVRSKVQSHGESVDISKQAAVEEAQKPTLEPEEEIQQQEQPTENVPAEGTSEVAPERFEQKSIQIIYKEWCETYRYPYSEEGFEIWGQGFKNWAMAEFRTMCSLNQQRCSEEDFDIYMQNPENEARYIRQYSAETKEKYDMNMHGIDENYHYWAALEGKPPSTEEKEKWFQNYFSFCWETFTLKNTQHNKLMHSMELFSQWYAHNHDRCIQSYNRTIYNEKLSGDWEKIAANPTAENAKAYCEHFEHDIGLYDKNSLIDITDKITQYVISLLLVGGNSKDTKDQVQVALQTPSVRVALERNYQNGTITYKNVSVKVDSKTLFGE
ncbi:MAG: hypothetical protein LBI69_01125 [Puniceicoccales bacterium]|jgi:hypothetical protein|nr:hypothetical protein [Puniceicoccales bacterium]